MTSLDAKPHIFHNWFNLFDAIVIAIQKLLVHEEKPTNKLL